MDVALPPAVRRRSASDFSASQVWVLCLVLVLLASIPIWTYPVPPLSDYINHLARMHVIALGGRDADLARYYEIDWQIVPNLVMDLVVPVLGQRMNIYLAGQVFIFLSFALTISGVLALNRSLFGRWSVVPFLAVPLLYNYVFLVGVMNYVFGIGLALWALAAWVALRDAAWPARLAVSALMVVALFVCHLFAVGLYGIGLFAFELWRLSEPDPRPMKWRLVEFVSAGVAFIPVIPLLLASPTLQLVGETYWEPRGKLDGVIYAIQTYSDIVALALAAIVLGAGAWAARYRLLKLHLVGWLLLAVSGAVYLAMPRVLFATYMADQRLPIAVAFMIIACLDIKLSHRLVRRGFVGVILLTLAIRLIEVNVSWAHLSTATSEFRSSVKRIKRGAKVLVAYGDRSDGEDVSELGLVHAACAAMIERSALVTTAFTVVGKQIMRVRPDYANMVDTEDGTPPSIHELVLDANQGGKEDGAEYWRGWANRFDYLYVLFTADETPNPDPNHLTLVQDGRSFQLYRIKKPA